MNRTELQQRLLATFRSEAQEHCRTLAVTLFELEKAEDPASRPRLIEVIFRVAHTLKGAARLVGERAAEGICQRLEGVFAQWKQQPAAADAAALEQVQVELTELRQSLGFSAVEPAAPVRTVSTDAPPAGGSAEDGKLQFVRVAEARVESILAQAEELLGMKTIGQERITALGNVAAMLERWHKAWNRVQPQLAVLRRYLDQQPDPEIQRALTDVLQFLDTSDDAAARARSGTARLARSWKRDQAWAGTLIDRLLDDTKEILMRPCGSLLEAFPAFVREASREQGKDIDVVLKGAETEVDRRVLEEIRDAVVHLVRNSIDHGLETPAERLAAGKPPRGTLTLSVVEHAGGSVEVAVSDDGRGIDPVQVKAAAVAAGLVTPAAAEQLDELEVHALLFASGFSTRRDTTALSGRGLGLAIVKEKVERLGGSVGVESQPGRGTMFQLLLPITLARFRGVFVEAGGRPFVLPATYVRAVVRMRPGAVRAIKGQATIDHDGKMLSLVPLTDLLQIPRSAAPGRPEPERGGFAVVLAAGRLQAACRVDGSPYETEIVMKNLGGLLRRVRYVAGATILGTGQVVPVLNASDLVLAATQQAPDRREPAPVRAAPAPRTHRILVVEDSITSRSLFKNILQGAGFDVQVAVDGIEAMAVLKSEPIDLVISDVQMPRMDGFELTRKIRGDTALTTLPVILITSLASREDKERGVDAGANAYVVKSSFDQSDLLQTVRRLL